MAKSIKSCVAWSIFFGGTSAEKYEEKKSNKWFFHWSIKHQILINTSPIANQTDAKTFIIVIWSMCADCVESTTFVYTVISTNCKARQHIYVQIQFSFFKILKNVQITGTYEYPISHHWLSSWWNLCIDCIDLIHSSSVRHAPGMYVWWIMTYDTLWLMYLTSVGGLAFHSLRVTICIVNASGDAITHAGVKFGGEWKQIKTKIRWLL